MKYSHRKAQMEANRLKNLANPNFEKRQVKYDREKKKREDKRNLRMQAIINGVELDMAYMNGMSNRQKKKEEGRIREAKKQRQERLVAMGLAPAPGSRESSPPTSEDEHVDGGVKVNGEVEKTADAKASAAGQPIDNREADSRSDQKAVTRNKRKTTASPRPVEEKKGAKKQKSKMEIEKGTPKLISTDGGFEKKSKSRKVDKKALSLAEPSEGEDSALTEDEDTVLQIQEGDDDAAIEEAGETINFSRLEESSSSAADDDESAGDAESVDDLDGEAEPEAEEDIPLSDLESLASEEKGDIIPHQRLSINNHAALHKAYKSIALPYSKLQFSDHMSTTTAESVQIGDIDDDLNRELAFYKQSLDAVYEARSKLKKEGVPFSRPIDYFAEMVKTDEHMGKIKQKLVDQAAGAKASAEARKQRDLKKFGKQVQIAKQQERAKEKKDTMDKINVLKRKRQNAGLDAADESELFDVALEDAAETTRKERAGRKAAGSGKPNGKRQKKNEKFGFGGKKRHAKSNDAESTNDMSGFSAKKMKGKKDKKPRLGKSKRSGLRA